MLELVKLENKYKQLLIDMLDEWIMFNACHETDNSPHAIFKNDYHNFNYYLDNLEYKNYETGKVPDSVYFLLDTNRNILIGAINIRHDLNEYLLNYGGHIGYGIRPSERNKGYGNEILKLGLVESRKIGLKKVLIICDEKNLGSEKIIINNKGILEDKVKLNDATLKRYWIKL